MAGSNQLWFLLVLMLFLVFFFTLQVSVGESSASLCVKPGTLFFLEHGFGTPLLVSRLLELQGSAYVTNTDLLGFNTQNLVDKDNVSLPYFLTLS